MSDVCKHKPVERVGLYIMVFIAMMNTCSLESDISDIKKDVARIEQQLANQAINSDR